MTQPDAPPKPYDPIASLRERQRAREELRVLLEVDRAATDILNAMPVPLLAPGTDELGLEDPPAQWEPTRGGRKRDHERIAALTGAIQEMAKELAAERRRAWEMAQQAHQGRVLSDAANVRLAKTWQSMNELYDAWTVSVTRFIAYMTVAREQVIESMPDGEPRKEILRMFDRAAQIAYPEPPQRQLGPSWLLALLGGAITLLSGQIYAAAKSGSGGAWSAGQALADAGQVARNAVSSAWSGGTK